MKSLLVSTVFAACAPQEAQDRLPSPTGPSAVGRTTFHWRDDSRDELETSAADDKRELLVHLFYPASADAKVEAAPYQPDVEVMRGAWRDDHVERVRAMTTHCREGAPMVAGDAKHPVLVFSPGGGMRALHYHVLLEDLASHGWVVAAIDPPYNARRTRMPDGRVLGDLSPAQRGWPQPKSPDDEGRFYRERIAHWARDVGFAIDRLQALDREDGPFEGRLDLARGVGVVGHSRGGQVAAVARVLEPRVRSGINIDGIAGEAGFTTEESEERVGEQPFLWLQKALPSPRRTKCCSARGARAPSTTRRWSRSCRDGDGGWRR